MLGLTSRKSLVLWEVAWAEGSLLRREERIEMASVGGSISSLSEKRRKTAMVRGKHMAEKRFPLKRW